MIYIGIDPSAIYEGVRSSYGALTVWDGSECIDEQRFNQDPEIIYLKLANYAKYNTIVGLENVWAMPWDTPKTAFALGGGVTLLKYFTKVLNLHTELITPKKWQKFYGLERDKKETKPAYKRRLAQKAKELFPNYKIIQNTADAYLIGNYTLKHYN